MPAFTVSAVSTTNDTLTSTGVAAVGQPEGAVLLTGDRFRLRNVGGALPAATPALASATDYWARRVDDDTIKIYDSNAHALAGGSTGLVDITGAGSGSTTIEFGLPYCLPTVNAAQGIQLRPFVVGNVWAALVALYQLLVGQAQSVFSGVTLAGPLSVGGFVFGVRTRQVIPTAWRATGTAPTLVANPAGGGSPIMVWKLPTAQTVRARIPHDIGETITSVKFEVYGDGAVDWVGNVAWNASSDGTGGGTVASNGGGVTNQSAAWAMSALTMGGIGALTSGGDLYIELVISGGTQLYLGCVEIGSKLLP